MDLYFWRVIVFNYDDEDTDLFSLPLCRQMSGTPLVGFYLVFTIYHFLGDSNNSLAKLSLACASLLFLLLNFVWGVVAYCYLDACFFPLSQSVLCPLIND